MLHGPETWTIQTSLYFSYILLGAYNKCNCILKHQQDYFEDYCSLFSLFFFKEELQWNVSILSKCVKKQQMFSICVLEWNFKNHFCLMYSYKNMLNTQVAFKLYVEFLFPVIKWCCNSFAFKLFYFFQIYVKILVLFKN